MEYYESIRGFVQSLQKLDSSRGLDKIIEFSGGKKYYLKETLKKSVEENEGFGIFCVDVLKKDTKKKGAKAFFYVNKRTFMLCYMLCNKLYPSGEFNLYEGLESNIPCKVYFDLEYKREDDETTFNMLKKSHSTLRNAIRSIFNTEDILFFDSSDDVKFSNHILLGDVYVKSNSDILPYVELFYNTFKQMFEEKEKIEFKQPQSPFVDPTVYKSFQPFRLPDSNKLGSNRVKKYVSYNPEKVTLYDACAEFKRSVLDFIIGDTSDKNGRFLDSIPKEILKPIPKAQMGREVCGSENGEPLALCKSLYGKIDLGVSPLNNSLWFKLLGLMSLIDYDYAIEWNRNYKYVSEKDAQTEEENARLWFTRNWKTNPYRKILNLFRFENELKRAVDVFTIREIMEMEKKEFFRAESGMHQILPYQKEVDIEVNQRYVDKNLLNDAKIGDVYLIQSAMGTGKTELLSYYVKENKNKRVLLISVRRTQARNYLNRFNAKSYLDIKEKTKIAKEDKLICSCESLYYIGRTSYDIVILDEVESILATFCGNRTTFKHYRECWDTFKYLLGNAELVIGLDAFLGERSINFFTGVCERKKESRVICMRNNWRPKSVKAYDYGSEVKIWESALHEKLVRTNERIYICCGTKTQADKINRMLEDLHIPTLYFNGKKETVQKGKDLLVDVGLWSDYRVVLTTPKITVGVDLNATLGEKGYFDSKFVYFSMNSCTIRDHIQMHYRPRNCNEVHFVLTKYLSEKCLYNYTSVEHCFDDLYKLKQEIQKEHEPPSFINDENLGVIMAYSKAEREYQRMNYYRTKKLMYAYLKHMCNYNIAEVTGCNDVNENFYTPPIFFQRRR